MYFYNIQEWINFNKNINENLDLETIKFQFDDFESDSDDEVYCDDEIDCDDEIINKVKKKENYNVDLSSLSKLTKLKSIKIFSISNCVFDLNTLKDCDSLEILSINCDIKPITILPKNLKEINLNRYNGDLKAFKNLEIIYCSSKSCLEDGLEECTKLKVFGDKFGFSPMNISLDKFKNAVHLEELYLSCSDKGSLKSLSLCTNLRILHIGDVSDLDSLKYLVNLEVLSISKGSESIKYLTKLKKLSIFKTDNLNYISELINLEELSVSRLTDYLEPNIFKKLFNLKFLFLHSYYEISISEFTNCKNLKKLSIDYPKDLYYIKFLINIESIIIETIKEDFSSFKYLDKCKTLRIGSIDDDISLLPLQYMKNLQVLHINRIKELQYPIVNCEQLIHTSFYCKPKNTRFLQLNKSLKNFYLDGKAYDNKYLKPLSERILNMIYFEYEYKKCEKCDKQIFVKKYDSHKPVCVDHCK